MDTLIGLLGYIGVVFMLMAYFLLTVGQLKATDTHHIVLNVLGSLFIVIAMHMGSTVPVLITLILWLVISLFGLWKHHVAVTE